MRVARETKSYLQRYGALQDLIAILGVEELSEEDKIVVTQSATPAEVPVAALLRRRAVHRYPGLLRAARRDDSTASRRSARVTCDHVPEQAFFMSSTIDDALAKAKEVIEVRPSDTPAEAQMREGAAAAAGDGV